MLNKEKEDRDLARCEGFDVQIEDHGLLVLNGQFAYESGGCQGFGYCIDAAFLVRFMEAVGVTSLAEVSGRSCWVTHTRSNILKIEPLHKKDGKSFDIEIWSSWHRRNTEEKVCPLRVER